MKRRDELRAPIVIHAAAEARDRVERPQQGARGKRAERDDHLRLDGVDLPEQKRLARTYEKGNGSPTGLFPRAPGGVAADARDAELAGEPQVFGELIAVHEQVRLARQGPAKAGL